MGEVVLVAGDGAKKGLAVSEAAEMERLSPAVLVKIGGEVVVARRASQVGQRFQE